MEQEILAYTTLAIAVGFLVKKFFFKKKRKDSNCGTESCGCH